MADLTSNTFKKMLSQKYDHIHYDMTNLNLELVIVIDFKSYIYQKVGDINAQVNYYFQFK